MSEISTVQQADPVATLHVSEWRRVRRVFLQRKLVLAGTIVLLLLVLVAIFAPLIAPHDPYLNDMSKALQNPSSNHLLGTDKLGRDTFSRLVYGSRTALLVGFRTVAVSAVVGMILGLLAAVLGGGLQNVIIALAVATLPAYTRLMCSETLSVKENEYIMAQRAIGSKSLRTMARHVLPNAFQPTLVLITTMLGNVILAEAALSFIGIGIQPPGAAWGSMAADGYRFLESHPLLSFAPCIAIMVVVFAFNMVGDGLRDALDPRLRGKL